MDEAEPIDTDFETSSMDEAEAMEIDKAPLLRDWRTLYLDWMIRGILPSHRAQHGASLGGPSLLS